VTASNKPYGDEMSSYQTTSPPRKAYWNPVIIPPTKIMNIPTPPLPVASSPPPSTAARWDWLLFSPEYYSELYTPSSTFVHYHQQKTEEEKDGNHDLNFLASLPRCLLALLCLTPKLIRTSDDENDSDQEIGSLHIPDEPLLSINPTDKKTPNISSNLSLSSNNNNIDGQNRSSTPDTDDGYQSASDASRSDYSQQSSIPYDHDITINEHSSLPTPLMPPRISYAAAVKPITKTTTTTVNKLSSLPTMIGKPKQIINNTLPTSTNDMLNTNGQKLKFIAPRFERMHHAKQYSSSSTTTIKNPLSNRTQIRSTNNNQRNHVVNPTRRC